MSGFHISVTHQCGDCGLIGPINAKGRIIGRHGWGCYSDEDAAIRDYLASPAAKKALADALHTVWQSSIGTPEMWEADAYAILAVWVASLEK